MDFCNDKTPHAPHAWGTDFNPCPGIAGVCIREGDHLCRINGSCNGVPRETPSTGPEVFLDEATHLTPADYDRIAKHLMELSKAAEEAREAKEPEVKTVIFCVDAWRNCGHDVLDTITCMLDMLLKERSTGTFTIELRVPKV